MPLCLRLSQMFGYIKKFDEDTTTRTTTMSLRVSDKIYGKKLKS